VSASFESIEIIVMKPNVALFLSYLESPAFHLII